MVEGALLREPPDFPFLLRERELRDLMRAVLQVQVKLVALIREGTAGLPSEDVLIAGAIAVQTRQAAGICRL